MTMSIIMKDDIRNFKKGFNYMVHDDAEDVIKIVADGEELKWIIENITGIPVCTGSSIGIWFGDHAKFIASQTIFWFK